MKTIFRELAYKAGKTLIKLASVNNLDTELVAHDVNGITLYTFHSNFNIPYIRHGALQVAVHSYYRRIALEDIKTCLELAKNAFNSKNFVQAAALMKRLEDFTDLEITNAVCLQLANAIILLPNEPKDEMKQYFADEKRKLFNENPAVRTFFLFTAIKLLLNTKKGSKTTTGDYLEYLNAPIVQQTEKEFLTAIDPTA